MSRGAGLTFLFSLTLFLSAALLFGVQPLIAKAILPLLGGAPAVWTTCMLFFQSALLAGYAYASWLPRWLGLRLHAVIHVALMITSLFVLPVTVPESWTPPHEGMPVFWLLGLLVVTVGLPFLALAANAPLLQSWFAPVGMRPPTIRTSCMSPATWEAFRRWRVIRCSLSQCWGLRSRVVGGL